MSLKAEPVTAAALAMDRMYRRQRYVYDITRKFYLLGRDRMIARLDARNGDGILEIGCGTGRNLIAIGQRYRGARLYGLDVSSQMLITATAAIAGAGLSSRVTLRQADASHFDPEAVLGRAQFERVVISYCLSMIPPWQGVLEAAAALLAPGGQLHIVDFGGQEGLPGWFRKALRRWLAMFHVTPRDTLEPALVALAEARGMTLAFERPYFGYCQRAVLTRPC